MNSKDIRRMRSLYLEQLSKEGYTMVTNRIRRMVKEVQDIKLVPLAVFVSSFLLILATGLLEVV